MPHTSCLQGRLTNFEKILQLIRIYIIEETALEGVLKD
jgi:hypothetical protein